MSSAVETSRGDPRAHPGQLASDGAGRWQRVLDLVERLREVPLGLRRFGVDAQTAARSHRIETALLDQLLEAGMPSVGRGDERRFDAYDLGNSALHLDLVSIQRRAIRSWAAAVRAAHSDDQAQLQVDVVAACPAPGHAGPCDYHLLQPGGSRRRIPVESPEPTQLTRLLLPAVRAPMPNALPVPLLELLHELDRIDFFLLPEAIRWSHEFLWRTRMGDCGVSADWLVRAGRRRGLVTRFRFGLLLASPYATPHCWAEVLVGDHWLAFDPMLVRAMHRWGGLDPVEYPTHTALNGLLHPLCDRFTKVVSHRGVWASVSLHTRRLAGRSTHPEAT
jgi:Transglutaminase-like superfamily